MAVPLASYVQSAALNVVVAGFVHSLTSTAISLVNSSTVAVLPQPGGPVSKSRGAWDIGHKHDRVPGTQDTNMTGVPGT